MKSTRAPVIILALSCAASGASAQWIDAPDVRSSVEAWRESWRVPGAAVAVIRGHDVLLLEGFGVRRLGGRDRVDAETLFELGSATKTFVATVAALAVEDGLLGWDTPLEEILPGFRLRDPTVQRHLTLLDALTHRSGIGRNELLWLSGATLEDVIRGVRHVQPSSGFRETFSYSNVMYMLAGAALGAVHDRSWQDLVAERVFAPLQMTRSGIGDDHGLPNVAWPHVQLGDTVIPARTPRTHVGPAGALISSASDMVPWLRFHLHAKGALADLRRPRVPLPHGSFGPQYARATHLAYGTGWFVSDYAGRPMANHIGGHGGMVALLTILPEDSIGVAVLTNHGDNLLPIVVTNHVLDLLLGLEPLPWNDTLHAFWDRVREGRAAAALAPGGERLHDSRASLSPSDYAGSYGSAVYGVTRISVDAGSLVLRHGTTLVGDLAHWHHDTFRITWRDPFMRAILGIGFASFHLDMAGTVAGLTWTGYQGERIETARRRASAPEAN